MNRTPPVDVRRHLRSEVGFGCPVSGCGNPYLYWHHFEPPWNVEQHHNPDGMIALCAEHHAKADAGAFSSEQLREMKKRGVARAVEVRGRFDWMRRELLAVVGGNFYLETPVIFEFKGEPAIWFNRDSDGYLLLNFRMLTTSGLPRARIEDNFWLPRGNPDDVESPPSGKRLTVSYANGDYLRIEFFEVNTAADFVRRYPEGEYHVKSIPFPITAVEVRNRVGGTNISFGPAETTFGGIVMQNCLTVRCRAGISIG